MSSRWIFFLLLRFSCLTVIWSVFIHWVTRSRMSLLDSLINLFQNSLELPSFCFSRLHLSLLFSMTPDIFHNINPWRSVLVRVGFLQSSCTYIFRSYFPVCPYFPLILALLSLKMPSYELYVPWKVWNGKKWRNENQMLFCPLLSKVKNTIY